MYGPRFPQIPPPMTADQFVTMANGLPLQQPPNVSQNLHQIAPPGINMTGHMIQNVMRIPYHSQPPNYSINHSVPGTVHLGQTESSFIPQTHFSQPSIPSIPPTSILPRMSTPGKTVFTPDYSTNNTSFSGIGTSFDTPQERTPVKSRSDFATNNTSFTGIGLSFDTPESSPAKSRSSYFCDVCNFDLGGEETYNKHCNGLMHKLKVSEKEGRKPPMSTVGNTKSHPLGNEETKPKVIQDLREKYPDQYCEICDTTMTSSSVFKQHLQGIRHKKNMLNRASGAPILRGRGNRRLPKEQAEAEQNLRCQKLLDECDDPLIGLQYMVEYTKNNPAVEERYVCELCDGKCDPRTLVPHIVGTKHRLNYIKKYHEKLLEPYAEDMKSMRKAEKTTLMADLAMKVHEIEDGAKRMKAKVEIDPFYNPNQDVKKTKNSDDDENHTAAQKRSQSADSGPPAKRPPKSKALPIWGGSDPEKQKRYLEESQKEERHDHHTRFERTGSPPYGAPHSFNGERQADYPVQSAKCTTSQANVDAHSGYAKENTSPMNASTKSGTAQNLPHNLSDIMKNLSKCLVNNEEEASMALQVSNTLTQALLQYRLKNLTSTTTTNTSQS